MTSITKLCQTGHLTPCMSGVSLPITFDMLVLLNRCCGLGGLVPVLAYTYSAQNASGIIFVCTFSSRKFPSKVCGQITVFSGSVDGFPISIFVQHVWQLLYLLFLRKCMSPENVNNVIAVLRPDKCFPYCFIGLISYHEKTVHLCCKPCSYCNINWFCIVHLGCLCNDLS